MKRGYTFYIEEELYLRLVSESKKQERSISYILNEILKYHYEKKKN